MNLNNFHDLLTRGRVNTPQQCFKAEEGYTLEFGTSAPSGAGYAPGCIFINTLTGLVYYNTGSKAACAWGAIGTGSTSIIDNNCILNDGGAVDARLVLTTQTGARPDLTIPDFAGVNDTFVFATKASTLAGKTLTAPVINGGTLNVASAGAKYMRVVCGTALGTADRTLTVTIPDAATGLTLTGDFIRVGAHSLTLTTGGATDVTLPTTGTLATLDGAESLSNKTLDDATCLFADSAGPTKKFGFECSGLTGGATRVLTVLDYNGTIPTYAGAANQGEILYCSAAGVWSRLAVGVAGEVLVTAGAASNPYWGAVSIATASALADGCTLTSVGNDPALAFTAQTGAAPTLTIPDFAGVNDEFVFKTKAVTMANKSLTAPAITGGSAIELTSFSLRSTGAAHDLVLATSAVYTGDRTLTINIPTGGDAALTLTGDLIRSGAHSLTLTTTNVTDVTLPTTGTLATLTGAEAFTNKTLDAANSWFVQTGGTDRGLKVDCSSIAGAFFTTLDVGNPLADRILTLPTTATTLVGHDTANTLTNKTIDVDSNTVSNLNADELDPITPGGATYGVPFVLAITYANLGAGGQNIFADNAPFKFRVIDAYIVATSGDGGNVQVNNGKVGALGNAITSNMACGADKAVTRNTSIDDAEHEIALNGSLVLVGSGIEDGVAYITCLRVD
ncbi:MAG: hypothetical protein ABIL09_07960 [Gemmatimonadota bacterium]